MLGSRRATPVAAGALLLLAAPLASACSARHSISAPDCSSGARTLSHQGDHVYPDMGDGGYRSVHTDVHLVYDATANLFLPGTEADLTDRATQCLTDLSLDFERTSALTDIGPDLTVGSITVNGVPARYRFVQPTYPGDPKGPNDPDPRAHQAGQNRTVGGPAGNPLPPACSPQLTTARTPDAQDGEPCPATKLVITPVQPIRLGSTFVVAVRYMGRPGVHLDGDGSTEGWFRSNAPAGDGGFVTTEPVGTMDWMPLNNHPSAKPTYDFYDTVTAGRTAVGNGILVSSTHNPPSRQFPAGSTSWHWRSVAPVASYLVENSVGSFDLVQRRAADGVVYYVGQPSSLSAVDKATNLAIMNQQQDITAFQSQFNGPFPFSSNGVLIGLPAASFQEEMQTMITFAGGSINLDTFNHENMHQWWGDNVTESNFDMTFFKEGLASLAEYLLAAREAQDAAGGETSAAGRSAFQASLVKQFDGSYADSTLFSGIPSDPTSASLYSPSSTYTRPGIAYIALRQILGSANFDRALQSLQRRYGGATITETQLEKGFRELLVNHSVACQAKLGTFYSQWFDTNYPTANGATKPAITGPGLSGDGFYDAAGDCS